MAGVGLKLERFPNTEASLYRGITFHMTYREPATFFSGGGKGLSRTEIESHNLTKTQMFGVKLGAERRFLNSFLKKNVNFKINFWQNSDLEDYIFEIPLKNRLNLQLYSLNF